MLKTLLVGFALTSAAVGGIWISPTAHAASTEN